MNINLALKDEEYLKSKVEAGYYTNVAEVIRDAIRRMREADNHYDELVEAIMVGERQIANGQYKPYTPELMQEIRQNAKKRAERGEKPSSDVIPR